MLDIFMCLLNAENPCNVLIAQKISLFGLLLLRLKETIYFCGYNRKLQDIHYSTVQFHELSRPPHLLDV